MTRRRQAMRLSALMDSGREVDPVAVAERIAQDAADAETVPAIRRRRDEEIAMAQAGEAVRMASCAAWCERGRTP